MRDIIPDMWVVRRGESQTAWHRKVNGERHLRCSFGVECSYGRRGDWTLCAKIEAIDGAPEFLRVRQVTIKANANIQRQIIFDTPIVIDEQSIVVFGVGAPSTQIKLAGTGKPEHE